MKWTNVKDKLPELNISVLTYDKYHGCKVNILTNAYFVHPEKYSAWDINNNDVTHWMPLPKPPK